MIYFTTSKGDFIAVLVIEWVIPKLFYIHKGKLVYDHGDLATGLPDGYSEIIGLSSDILKDEELAKRVVDNKWPNVFNHTDLFQEILEIENITGNQLIIKKK